jgi:hypothetical protein
MLKVEKVKDYIVPKAKWYLRYRTQLWSTVFMIVGIVGGSVATIQTYIPSLKYDTVVIENRLNQLDEVTRKLSEIQEILAKNN